MAEHDETQGAPADENPAAHTYSPAEGADYWSRADWPDKRHEFRALAMADGVRIPQDARISRAYEAIGKPNPIQFQRVNVVLPPDATTGLCCHCGRPAAGNRRVHAVAGFEHTPLRLEVLHCEECVDGAACDPTTPTPGSGHPDGSPGGFCEPLGRALTLQCEVIPGIHYVGRLIKWAAAVAALGIAAFGLIHSQGQQLADLTGTTGAIAVQDSTSGHGYNAGTLAFFTGSAPATANAAETGTDLCDVTLPNPLFGVPSGLPSVATANAITAATISNSGTVGYGRMKENGDGGTLSTTARRLQYTVGTTGADCNFNTLSLVSGGSLSITSLTYQHAA